MKALKLALLRTNRRQADKNVYWPFIRKEQREQIFIE